VPDLRVLWVMAQNQLTPKSLRFIDGLGLRGRIRFAVDPESRAIDALGIRRPRPEPIEVGVPHPTTILLDRDGVIRFADLRADFRHWLDPALVRQALATLR
jgi:peroxiredoxin